MLWCPNYRCLCVLQIGKLYFTSSSVVFYAHILGFKTLIDVPLLLIKCALTRYPPLHRV